MSRCIWFCDKCHALGVIVHEGGFGAYDVIRRIQEAHRSAGPGCTKGARVLDVEAVESDTILMSGVGEW